MRFPSSLLPQAVTLPLGEVLLWLKLSIGIALVLLSARLYGGIWKRARESARDRVLPFTLPDAMVCLILFTWLGDAISRGFGAPPRQLNDVSIIEGGLLFVVVVTGILLFLQVRKISIPKLFGLNPENPGAVLKRALHLFAAALPLVYASFAIVNAYTGEAPQPQDLTQYFQDAAISLDWYRIGLVLLVAAVVAPVTEEFLFRGYFYGVLKRYLGVSGGLLLVSALFAAIHLNAGVLLPLFVLAVCLTLAYEATQSLLAPILIHSLFNTSMLALMFYTARHP